MNIEFACKSKNSFGWYFPIKCVKEDLENYRRYFWDILRVYL